jgi:hypothetical protein
VTRSRIIVKDHLAENSGDHWRLGLLDILGNFRHRAGMRGRYLSTRDWSTMFEALNDFVVLTHHGLMLRKGLMALLFSNDLEVIFQLDRVARASVEPSPSRAKSELA